MKKLLPVVIIVLLIVVICLVLFQVTVLRAYVVKKEWCRYSEGYEYQVYKRHIFHDEKMWGLDAKTLSGCVEGLEKDKEFNKEPEVVLILEPDTLKEIEK